MYVEHVSCEKNIQQIKNSANYHAFSNKLHKASVENFLSLFYSETDLKTLMPIVRLQIEK